MKTKCIHCGQDYEIEPSDIGCLATCDACGNDFTVQESKAIVKHHPIPSPTPKPPKPDAIEMAKLNGKQEKSLGRISLTKRQLATEEGQAILELLMSVLEDGRLSDQEILRLSDWLKNTAGISDVSGIHFLREEVGGILADGIITDAERQMLANAILRVMPPTNRKNFKSLVKKVEFAT